MASPQLTNSEIEILLAHRSSAKDTPTASITASEHIDANEHEPEISAVVAGCKISLTEKARSEGTQSVRRKSGGVYEIPQIRNMAKGGVRAASYSAVICPIPEFSVPVKNDVLADSNVPVNNGSVNQSSSIYSSNWRPGNKKVTADEPYWRPERSPSVNSWTGSVHGEVPNIGEDGRTKQGILVTKENAQAIFAPTACAFVANLPYAVSDKELYEILKVKFGVFANVEDRLWLNIRRDEKLNPYCFVQYATDKEAARAIRLGSGMVIEGRAVRTEHCKAHRLFYISGKEGSEITESEARAILATVLGEDEEMWKPTDIERALYKLPTGYFFKAKDWAKARNAAVVIKRTGLFEVTSINCSPTSAHKSPINDARQHADRCTIFIGNLALSTTEGDIYQNFENYGQIREIKMRCQPSNFEGGVDNKFAFLEFVDMESARVAIEFMHGWELNGKRLRVTAKDPNHKNAGQNGGGKELSHANLHRHTFGNGKPYLSPLPSREEIAAAKAAKQKAHFEEQVNVTVNAMYQASMAAYYNPFRNLSVQSQQYVPAVQGQQYTPPVQAQQYAAPAQAQQYAPAVQAQQYAPAPAVQGQYANTYAGYNGTPIHYQPNGMMSYPFSPPYQPYFAPYYGGYNSGGNAMQGNAQGYHGFEHPHAHGGQGVGSYAQNPVMNALYGNNPAGPVNGEQQPVVDENAEKKDNVPTNGN